MEPGHELELRHDPAGYRYYLDGLPVHAGDQLELKTDQGWTPGPYEWSSNIESPPYLVTDTDSDQAVTRDEYALLRWPT